MPAETSEELAKAIMALPCPVIFLDTAALLDLLRAPYRSDVDEAVLASCVDLVEDLTTNPRKVWVVITDAVVHEVQDNLERVSNELKNNIRSLRRMLTTARTLFPERDITVHDWLEAHLFDRVLGVMSRLQSSSMVFSGGDACMANANRRLFAGRAPSARSKQQYKDCLIFEEFLELARHLRSAGFLGSLVFVTPNKVDYGRPPVGADDIADDLQQVSGLYCSNITWAMASIRGHS